jgi:hypothetical protein
MNSQLCIYVKHEQSMYKHEQSMYGWATAVYTASWLCCQLMFGYTLPAASATPV